MPQPSVENILSQLSFLSSDERKALIAALTTEHVVPVPSRQTAYGKYAGLLTPVEHFLRIKHEETERENGRQAQ